MKSIPAPLEVHGITAEFLLDKPRFEDVAAEFLEFIRDAELIIHNAEFDVGFLSRELQLADAGYGPLEDYCETVLDTLAMARKLHPGQRNSLDALCKRYQVDNAHRELHGALLDAEILADVYLVMTGGQTNLLLEAAPASRKIERVARSEQVPLPVIRPDAEELALHEEWLRDIDEQTQGGCVWLQAHGRRRRLKSIPAAHNALLVALPVPGFLGGAFVVGFFAFAEADLQLRPAAFPIHCQGDQSIAFTLYRTDKFAQFTAVQQQLARSRRIRTYVSRGRQQRRNV